MEGYNQRPRAVALLTSRGISRDHALLRCSPLFATSALGGDKIDVNLGASFVLCSASTFCDKLEAFHSAI